MAGRSNATYIWNLDPSDPTSVPNARIALALCRCIRRLPGVYPDHGFDDLGGLLAPVLEGLRGPLRLALKAYIRSTTATRQDLEEIEIDNLGFLHDRQIQTVLGELWARSNPCFRVLGDKAEQKLSAFVVRHPHSSDRNVETLTELLGLGAAEARYIRLAAAFCYGTLARGLFSFVDSNTKLTKAIEVLCDVRGTEALRIFDANRPLARSGLIDLSSRPAVRRDLEDLLCLSRVGERLLSAPFAGPAEMSAAVLSPLPARSDGAPLQWPHLETPQALLRAALTEALKQRTRGFNVLLYGAPGTGKTEFARLLAADIGASGFSIDHIDDQGGEASRDDRLASLRLSQTFASQHERSLLVLDEAEDIFQSDYQNPFARLFRRSEESKGWVNNLLETNAHPVIWIGNQVSHLDPAYLRRFTFCLEFPPTPFALRHQIAEKQLSAVGCSAEMIEAVAAREETTPALLATSVNFAKLSSASGLGPDRAIQTILDEHAKAAGRKATPLVPRRLTRFDMKYLNAVGSATPERLLQALRADAPAALLFSGPPGTGKTQFAAEIAKQLGRRLAVRTASDINSKWYGESEANVARMFRDCDPKAELLFLDEAEVVLQSRGTASHRADRAVTAEFLRWLEAFEGIFVCATNHSEDFDAALMRRFTFRMEFKPLAAAQRESLYLELTNGWTPPDGNPAPSLDTETTGRLKRLDHLTPGDFANVARRTRSLGLGSSDWIAELEAEHRAKGGAVRQPIGFT